MASNQPFYTAGTLTGGLLQQPAGQQASTNYVPGSGMPLYNTTQNQAGQLGGQIVGNIPGPSQGASQSVKLPDGRYVSPPKNMSPGEAAWWANKMSSLASGRDFAIPLGAEISDAPRMSDDLTVIGQDQGWMSPGELRDQTNGLGGSGSGSGGTGGMGAGNNNAGAGAGTGSGSGLFGNNPGSGSGVPNYSTPGGLGGFPNIPVGGNGGTGPINSGGQSGGGSNMVPGSQISGGQPLGMMQMGAGNALQNYYNTPGYQLTNGMGAYNQFQTSPGYQFAVDQALKQVQRQGSSRGLLDSGAGLQAMTDRAQGMAQQEFNNWQTNQQNQYNAYQNRLAGLAGGPTGAEQAYGMGQGMAANAMNTGNNIGSILANQGNSLFGGIVGAGGAQAQNVTQAGNMQAQILAGNLQTQMALAALAAGQQRS